MGDHYPLCEQYISGDGLPCICGLLSQHGDDVHIAMTSDLRAKVEALPPWLSTNSPLMLAVSRADVLDLIDGGR